MAPSETILRHSLLASKESLHLRHVMGPSSCQGQDPLKKTAEYCNRTTRRESIQLISKMKRVYISPFLKCFQTFCKQFNGAKLQNNRKNSFFHASASTMLLFILDLKSRRLTPVLDMLPHWVVALL